MKNKILWILIALLMSGANALQAQVIKEKNPSVNINKDAEDEEESADVDDEEGDDEDISDEEGDAGDNEETVNDEEITLPESMTIDTDSLLNLYHSKYYLTPDTNCRMRDVNPVFEKEVFIDRLRRLPTIIEMPYNEVVQKFIDQYSGRLRRSVSYMLGASNFYMPIFEEALEMYGLPLELKYLPVIESALNPKAVSRVGATGLWQFMLTTGKQYGLKVNTLVDERKDPIKASYAAARYLRDLYRIFDDWTLVIAAYNCGPNKVNQAIHRADGNADYWQIYPYLPKETRGYVPAFIAANYIMNYYCEHNICPMLTDLPSKSDTIVVSRDVHFKQIAEYTGIEVEQLRTLNPQYRYDIVNGLNEPMAIRMPLDVITTFIDNEDSIYAYKADELLTKRTVVDVREDLPTYTRSYTSYKGRKSAARGKKGKGKKGSRTRGKSVTVRGGDTLSSIAKRNGTTVAKLKKLNGIRGNKIQKGKKLKVK